MLRASTLLFVTALAGWCTFLFAGGIYRLVDDKAGHGSIVGLVISAALIPALGYVGLRVWRGNLFKPSDATDLAPQQDDT